MCLLERNRVSRMAFWVFFINEIAIISIHSDLADYYRRNFVYRTHSRCTVVLTGLKIARRLHPKP